MLISTMSNYCFSALCIEISGNHKGLDEGAKKSEQQLTLFA